MDSLTEKMRFIPRASEYIYTDRSCRDCRMRYGCVAVVGKDFSLDWLDLAKTGCWLYVPDEKKQATKKAGHRTFVKGGIDKAGHTPEEFVRLRNGGMDVQDIAAKWHVARLTLIKWRKAHGLSVDSRQPRLGRLDRILTESRYIALLRTGRTFREIAELYGTTPEALRRWRDRHHLDDVRGWTDRRGLTAKDILEIKKRCGSWTAAAEELRCTPQTLLYVRRRLGMPIGRHRRKEDR